MLVIEQIAYMKSLGINESDLSLTVWINIEAGAAAWHFTLTSYQSDHYNAQALLKKAHYNVEAAINLYYDSGLKSINGNQLQPAHGPISFSQPRRTVRR